MVFCCYKNRKKYFSYMSLYLTVRLINLSALLLWRCSYPSRRLCAAISRTIQHNTHRVHRAHHRDYFNVCSSAEALLNTQTHSVLWVCEHWARQALSLKTTLQGKVVLSAFPKENNNEWELLGLIGDWTVSPGNLWLMGKNVYPQTGWPPFAFQKHFKGAQLLFICISLYGSLHTFHSFTAA